MGWWDTYLQHFKQFETVGDEIQTGSKSSCNELVNELELMVGFLIGSVLLVPHSSWPRILLAEPGVVSSQTQNDSLILSFNLRAP